MAPTDFGIENSNKKKYEEFDIFTTERGGGNLSHKYSSSFIFWKLPNIQLYLKLIIMQSSGCFSDVWEFCWQNAFAICFDT